jgi:hypothetical protein
MSESPLPKSPKEAVGSLIWGTFTFAAGFELVNSSVHGDWLPALGSFAVLVLLVTAVLFTIHRNARISFLPNWQKLTEVTDLAGFEERNIESKYMPNKILARPNVIKLFAMGNGCSKWTRIGSTAAIDSFRQIRKGGGDIRFLASCPIHLSQISDETKRKKAKRNAESLTKLRTFAEQSRSAGGIFEIRTYKHVATLRLIIVNDTECVVGHYQEDGDGDSIETPLLVFNHTNDNRWGFGGAFRRMFDSEWHRATVPTAEEWKKIEELRDSRE